MRFGKQVVLVTGGSSGIGLATAEAFLSEGAKVAISARNLPRLRAATRSLRTFGDVLPIRGDVSKATDVQRVVLDTKLRRRPRRWMPTKARKTSHKYEHNGPAQILHQVLAVRRQC